MVDRKPLTSIFGLAVTLREPRANVPAEADAIRHNNLVLARKDNGHMVAQLDRDELFDRDGNRFYND